MKKILLTMFLVFAGLTSANAQSYNPDFAFRSPGVIDLDFKTIGFSSTDLQGYSLQETGLVTLMVTTIGLFTDNGLLLSNENWGENWHALEAVPLINWRAGGLFFGTQDLDFIAAGLGVSLGIDIVKNPDEFIIKHPEPDNRLGSILYAGLEVPIKVEITDDIVILALPHIQKIKYDGTQDGEELGTRIGIDIIPFVYSFDPLMLSGKIGYDIVSINGYESQNVIQFGLTIGLGTWND